ncbi:MAG: hypothetical protein L3K24_15430 [Gammaproteobacteria bacterium]|nr:hypothetical protein [Gammaproteobacteria bacterium]
MSAVIKSTSQDSVTIEVTISLAKSMLDCEEKITSALNDVGCLASRTALEKFDTDGTPILIGDDK